MVKRKEFGGYLIKNNGFENYSEMTQKLTLRI